MPQRLEPTYREALAEAWRFVGMHKFLWVLGAISVVLGEFGFTNFIGRLWRFFTNSASLADFWWLPTSFRGLTDVRFIPALDSLTLCIIASSLLVFIVVVGVISQGALIAAGLTFFRTKKMPTLTKVWHKGTERFWHILGVKVLENFLLFILLSLVVMLLSILPTDLFFFVLIRATVVAAATLGGVMISTMSVFASAYIVDKDYPIVEALHEGWMLFSQHVLVAIELSVIFLLLTGFVVLAVCIAAYVVTVFGLFLIVLGVIGTDPFITMLGISFSSFLFVLATALIGGFFNAYVLSGWMYCYIKMHRKGIPSRLLHFKEHLSRSV